MIYYDNKWIYVEKHPKALPSDVKSDTVYCLITNTHTIPIKDYIFHDWDEMIESDYHILSKKLEINI